MSEGRTSLIGGCLVAIGPISLALYTPAMPTLVSQFATSEAMVKLSLAVYFAGFAFTQLVCGPVSDAYGRRVTTLVFMVIYLAGAMLAVVAPTVGILIAARLLQGIGASVGVATARAIVRDQFTGETSSQVMNTIGIILAIGPAVSPTIGGLLLDAAGWHSLFFLMAGFGIAVILVTVGFMRETIEPDRSRIKPRAIFAAYRELTTNRHFLATSLTVAGSVGALYTLATVLPFVLIEVAGLTPTQYGMGMLAQSGSFFLGSIVARLLMARLGAYRLVPIGLVLIGIGAAAMAISIAVLPISYLSIMVPVAFYAFGIALVMPAMTTASLAPFPHMAGAAAAMMGFIQMGSGLLGGIICAAIGEPVLATQLVIPALGVLAIGSYIVYRRHPHLAEPEPMPEMPAPPMPRAGRASPIGRTGE
ncbi:multidrug effflux MFS transporter [Jiella sp. MQZ9-1]|uniref:Bcr/CflA family efflux transporter n=1 Tax=Jiella flava TaxID=2816857 RepID=A0A939JXX1_9HYPH|nr:multidrug effflux MFS transporter [Jiella flava]MBO0664537.1 multidrug effflux MFS transporter [Jiella flava]MCD2473171.1 multidrug effflux MFS transporter [Jiella flava]